MVIFFLFVWLDMVITLGVAFIPEITVTKNEKLTQERIQKCSTRHTSGIQNIYIYIYIIEHNNTK